MIPNFNEIDVLLLGVRRELMRAMEKHAPMHSPHEAYGVILEELDEFWDEVKEQHPDEAAMIKELTHVAAMAVRAIYDTCEPRVA